MQHSKEGVKGECVEGRGGGGRGGASKEQNLHCWVMINIIITKLFGGGGGCLSRIDHFCAHCGVNETYNLTRKEDKMKYPF